MCLNNHIKVGGAEPIFWKARGEHFSLNDIDVNGRNSPEGVVNTVSGWDSGATGICQYPLFKSRGEKTQVWSRSLGVTGKWGSGVGSS